MFRKLQFAFRNYEEADVSKPADCKVFIVTTRRSSRTKILRTSFRFHASSEQDDICSDPTAWPLVRKGKFIQYLSM